MARPKAAAVVEASVQIPCEKPAEGTYRVVLALVDERGVVKQADWTMSAQAVRHLPERYSWEQYVYPAILKVMQRWTTG